MSDYNVYICQATMLFSAVNENVCSAVLCTGRFRTWRTNLNGRQEPIKQNFILIWIGWGKVPPIIVNSTRVQTRCGEIVIYAIL